MNWAIDGFTTGRTVLVMKYRERGNDFTNFRSIKYFFFCIASWNVRGCCQRNKRGCYQRKLMGAKDQLVIGKMFLRNYKGRLTLLGMAWIGCKEGI